MPKVAKKVQAAKTEAKGQTQAPTRPVIYGKAEVQILELTAEMAKKFLGWEEEDGKVKFGDSYVHDIRPLFGRKIRLTNNLINRIEIRKSNVLNLAQEILRRRWYLNLENRIIGKSGQVLNGQHTFLALILAAELHSRHPENYPAWPEGQEPTITTSIGLGADESDEAVNTMDTCLPRTLYDVIGRSPIFRDMDHNHRRMASRLVDSAVRLLWTRTGRLNTFGVRRNHSEAIDFLLRTHPRITQCVRHIMEENEGNKIARYLSPGNASGLMYLMSVGATDPAGYKAAQDPTEELLDFSQWDKAQEFWVLVAGDAKELEPVKKALGRIIEETGSISNGEKWGILVNAWNCFIKGSPITPADLKLNYKKDQYGVERLDEEDCPTCGGIDLGNPKRDSDASTIHSIPEDEPTEAEQIEIEKRKAEVDEGKHDITTSGRAGKIPVVSFSPKKDGKDWAKGDVAWVYDSDGNHYLARLVEDPYAIEGGTDGFRVMVNDGKAEWEVLVKDLSLERPKDRVRIVPRPMTPAEKTTAKKPVKPGQIKVGCLVWVKEASGDHWQGRLVEQIGKSCKVKVQQGFRGAGNIRPVHLHTLSLTQPQPQAKAAV